MRYASAMRLAIISDIHANVHALEAVLTDIQSNGADQVLCLGDLVGYNAFPRETLALLQDHGVKSVHGIWRGSPPSCASRTRCSASTLRPATP